MAHTPHMLTLPIEQVVKAWDLVPFLVQNLKQDGYNKSFFLINLSLSRMPFHLNDMMPWRLVLCVASEHLLYSSAVEFQQHKYVKSLSNLHEGRV